MSQLVDVHPVVFGLIALFLAVAILSMFRPPASQMQPWQELQALQRRLAEIETWRAGAVMKVDLQAVTDRLGKVENEVAGIRGELSGILRGVGNIQRQLEMLVEHQMKEG